MQFAKFKSNGDDLHFNDAITALMLLNNSNVDGSHRVSILSSVSLNAEVEGIDATAVNADYITMNVT